jgi:hypothetical protein
MTEPGYARLTGALIGEYIVALQPDAFDDALRECPGLPIFRPSEIRRLEAVRAQGSTLRLIAMAKAVFPGAHVTATGKAPTVCVHKEELDAIRE